MQHRVSEQKKKDDMGHYVNSLMHVEHSSTKVTKTPWSWENQMFRSSKNAVRVRTFRTTLAHFNYTSVTQAFSGAQEDPSS